MFKHISQLMNNIPLILAYLLLGILITLQIKGEKLFVEVMLVVLFIKISERD
jgi:hypothetical protein